jgi:hypothetical protein
VDVTNPLFIRALKARVYEDTQYEEQIQRWKSYNGVNMIALNWLSDNMFVVPVHRKVVEKGYSTLDKDGTSHDDCLDA